MNVSCLESNLSFSTLIISQNNSMRRRMGCKHCPKYGQRFLIGQEKIKIILFWLVTHTWTVYTQECKISEFKYNWPRNFYCFKTKHNNLIYIITWKLDLMNFTVIFKSSLFYVWIFVCNHDIFSFQGRRRIKKIACTLG